MKRKIYFNIARLKQILLCIGIALICTSCYQDVIDIDLTQIDKRIVIEGVVSQSSSCKVIISETSNIYSTGGGGRISGAFVSISDDQGNMETLNETEPGVYISSSLRGVPGRTYSMEANVNGKVYTAVSKMPVPLELDSIVYNPIYYPVPISLYFTDHIGMQDFCRFKIYKNQQYLEDEKILYNDNYTDGEVIKVDNIEELFHLNDNVRIELITIDKNIYDFYSVFINYEEPEDPEESIIDMASANPKSNISNNALGYFSAQTVRNYSITIR